MSDWVDTKTLTASTLTVVWLCVLVKSRLSEVSIPVTPDLTSPACLA